MRKNEKQELSDLIKRVRSKFRPMEMDKMTIGDWKSIDEELSKALVKLEREIKGEDID